ncbi:MAG TPA: hypothetical protein P5267_02810, partial [Patescibacteria group bacterium]|nr:hypothetical protein [Patescibacteria group bacterium]
AESALSQLGYIIPKPLYYIGQYSLVVLLAKFFNTSVSLVDKLLVPVLSSAILPGLIYQELKNILDNKKILLASMILALTLITPLFFYTVPQSLANLLLLILIFTSLPLIIQQQKIPVGQWLILIAIFFIHPLSAMPGLIYLGFWSLIIINKHRSLKFLFLLLSAIIMPLLFILMANFSNDFGISFSWPNLLNFSQTLGSNIFNYLPFYSVYHLVYLYNFNSLLLFLLFFSLGIFYLHWQKYTKFVVNYLLLLGALLIGLVLVALISFSAVIDYEQAEFAKRLLQVIALLAAPIVLIGFYLTLKKILALAKGRVITIFFVGLILSFSLYLSYPHNDALEKGRNYAVSAYDLEAVSWIDSDAVNTDYVVLANQSVSAASLQEFGFKKYYISTPLPTLPSSEGRPNKVQQLFYYPIPTSSPLYEIYLDLIYNGVTMEKIQKARELTGASKVYLVINDYWLDAKKRVEEAKLLTKRHEEIEGRVWVFGFKE